MRPENRARQHPLHGRYASHEIAGQRLDQWQYEVTAGGRIWYCPDLDRRIVWVVFAGTGHPSATD